MSYEYGLGASTTSAIEQAMRLTVTDAALTAAGLDTRRAPASPAAVPAPYNMTLNQIAAQQGALQTKLPPPMITTAQAVQQTLKPVAAPARALSEAEKEILAYGAKIGVPASATGDDLVKFAWVRLGQAWAKANNKPMPSALLLPGNEGETERTRVVMWAAYRYHIGSAAASAVAATTPMAPPKTASDRALEAGIQALVAARAKVAKAAPDPRMSERDRGIQALQWAAATLAKPPVCPTPPPCNCPPPSIAETVVVKQASNLPMLLGAAAVGAFLFLRK